MKFVREFAIRLFDFIGVRGALGSRHLVVILIFHQARLMNTRWSYCYGILRISSCLLWCYMGCYLVTSIVVFRVSIRFRGVSGLIETLAVITNELVNS